MINWDMSEVGKRCPDCMHPQHPVPCGRQLLVNGLKSGTCRCQTTQGRDFADQLHQKSEGCWCGAHIDVEGSEASVLAACKNFRFQHSHKQPSKVERIKGVLDELMNGLNRTMEHDEKVDIQGQIHGLSVALAILTDMTVLGMKP